MVPPPPPKPQSSTPTITANAAATSSGGGGGGSSSSFPIVAITVLGILTTVALLLAYYIFVVKCYLHPRRRGPHPSRTVELPHRRPFPPVEPRGLDGPTIRSLPIVPFRRGASATQDCAVCLAEFLDGEKLRLLPGCAHPFHVDCVDTWLQSSANCPLCRAAVSAPHPPPVLAGADVESGGGDRGGELPRHVASMGDEWVGARRKEVGMWSPVQPVRRSFSMDSSTDRRLLTAVQEALRPGAAEDEGRVRRSFFSFGHGRSAVLPVSHLDL